MELAIANPRGEALAIRETLDQHIADNHGPFWEPAIQRLAKIAKERIPQSRENLQDWLPDLNAHVEAQFDTLNKKKDWYPGVVTQVNGDDTMTVLFRTNVSEQNLHPDKVRLLPGKPPKISKRYRGTPVGSVEGYKVGEAVEAPFEGNVKKMCDGGIVKTNEEDGTADICFRFNPNVIEHGIPVGKLERKLTMDPALASKKRALDKIMKHPDSRDFLKPVLALWPLEAIPGYTDIIKRPMDLGTVKFNLSRGLYNGKPHEMLADMELVFNNCQTYTGYDTTSEYYLKAGRMLDYVREAFQSAESSAAGGGQKRSAPEAASSAAPPKRPAFGLGAPPAARSLHAILQEVMNMPSQSDKPEMEYAQKELLLGEINELEEAAVNGVIDIIKLAESIEDDSEIDLGELQSSTMWKLRLFVDKLKAAQAAGGGR